MNTLITFGGFLATLWLSVSFAYGTLANSTLGFIFLGLSFVLLILTIEAGIYDYQRIRNGPRS